MAAALVTLGCSGVAVYAAWFTLVVQRSTSRAARWGPQWLSVALSGVLYRFGMWYLRFTIDTDEAIKSGRLDTSKQYMMVWHPHGAFAITALYFFAHLAAKNAILPDGKLFCAVADLLLQVPGLAEYLLLCNARSIKASSMDSLLSQGCTVAIQPGGIHEQVHTDQNQECVYFPARLGFVRLAIKHGVTLLPMYSFGENQLYNTSSWLRRINLWFYNSFKVGNLLVHGCLWNLPVSPVLPNPLMLPVVGRDLHLRFGEPVDVGPAESEPSDERVLEVFERYKAALQKLFDTHKDTLLPKEVAARGIKIVLRENKSGAKLK